MVPAEKLPLASLLTIVLKVLLDVAAVIVVFNELILEIFDTTFVFKLLIELVIVEILEVFEARLFVSVNSAALAINTSEAMEFIFEVILAVFDKTLVFIVLIAFVLAVKLFVIVSSAALTVID